jgi:hypothetical protein
METKQFHFKQEHKITSPQQALDRECMKYVHIPRDAKSIMPKESEIEIRFIADLPGEPAQIWCYAARKDDDICLFAYGQIKSGQQTTDRGFYADSIELCQSWLSPVVIVNQVSGMARIRIQTHGYHRIFVRVGGRGTWYVDMAGMC